MPVKRVSGGAGTFTANNLADDYFDVIHNAGAASLEAICLNFGIKNKADLAEFSYNTTEATTGSTISNAGEIILLSGIPWQDKSFNFRHDAVAAVNGTQVYFRPDGSSGFSGRFVSNNSSAANGTIDTNDGSGEKLVIWYDTNASKDSCAVAYKEGNSNGDRILVDDPNSKGNQFVKTNKGRYVSLKATSVAGQPILYFNSGGGVAANRFLFVSPTLANSTNDTLSYGGYDKIEGGQILPVYFNESANQYDRFQYTGIGASIDLYIPFLDRVLKIKYSATAAADGVLTYYNSGTGKFNFVSPTAANSKAYFSVSRRPYGFLTSGVIA